METVMSSILKYLVFIYYLMIAGCHEKDSEICLKIKHPMASVFQSKPLEQAHSHRI